MSGANEDLIIATVVQSGDAAKAKGFEIRANVNIAVGVLLIIVGVMLARFGDHRTPWGMAVWGVGFSFFLWGCVNYARFKGLSGWFGFFGYLALPGLIVLACLPNHRKRMSYLAGPDIDAQRERLLVSDRRSSFLFLLILVPIAMMMLLAGGSLLFLGRPIAAAEWQTFSPPDGGFQILAPGQPQVTQQKLPTAAGNVVITRYTVQPRGRREVFLITDIEYPPTAGQALGGQRQLLVVGRQDVITATKGSVTNERQVVTGQHQGIELDILPATGASVRCRVFATGTHLYQVVVHVAKIRQGSDDVRKFLDSFTLVP